VVFRWGAEAQTTPQETKTQNEQFINASWDLKGIFTLSLLRVGLRLEMYDP